MQNQDPLNPIESSDYAVQLATFSGVEQQVKTNELLQSLSAQMGLSGMAEIAGWVGMEARSEAPAWFDGQRPVTLSPDPAPGADQAFVIVRDTTGKEASRQAIPVSAGTFDWDGRDTAGMPLPAGLYSFTLESQTGGKVIATGRVETYGRIIEAQGTDDGPVLILEGGTTVAPGAISALREG
ncbi:flagellar basal body rod modification protein [Thioclava atlantica]|uniref:Basal-body rod modification protein FlgD n=2 Tax=Thioclava atlantica TaxID=1317124 RepID=A0A085TTN7_9RHOB|nr:flagellar basal body rod modification protein [Thioclava atlantica]